VKSEESVYGICNNALFTEDWDTIEILAPYYNLLTMSLDKLRRISGIFWRGVRANIFEQYPIGSLIFWLPFTSTTTSLKLLNSEAFLGKTGERTIFSIETDRAVDIRLFSLYGSEQERLVVCGSLFKVATVGNPGEGLHMISLRQSSGSSRVPDIVFKGVLKQVQATRAVTWGVPVVIVILVIGFGVAAFVYVWVTLTCGPGYHRKNFNDCTPCGIHNVTSYSQGCFIEKCDEGFERADASCVPSCNTGYKLDGSDCVPCGISNVETYAIGCYIDTCKDGFERTNYRCLPFCNGFNIMGTSQTTSERHSSSTGYQAPKQSFNSTLVFSCKEGYQDGFVTFVCEEDGNFQAKDSSCQEIEIKCSQIILGDDMENVDCDLNSTLTAVSGQNTCNVQCAITKNTGQYVCSNEGGDPTTTLECGKPIFSD
jgi:hypothetical protein